MPARAKTVALGRESAGDGPPGTRRHPDRSTATSEEPLWTLMVDQVLDAVGRSIPLDHIELPEEFFPAHLPVALVDTVFRCRLGHGEQTAPPAERYCRYFGVARRRADLWELPEPDEQETLADLMSHYHELGVDGMANEVFQSRCCFPGTAIGRAGHVLNVARALRTLGVEILQDVRARRPEKIAKALGRLPGTDEEFVRRLLMYTGDDEFVRGDQPVRSFVARALGRKTISAAHAAEFVRESAYELVLSPRYLDYRIWLCGTAPHALNGEAKAAR